MRINDAGLDLIKRFEGFEPKAYRDPVGVWTIGYGTTSRAGIGVTVSPGMEVSEEQASQYLMAALDKFGEQILPGFQRKPNENQYAAMLSLAYNIGPGAFRKSTCLKRFNKGDDEGSAQALQWFNKAGGKVLRGLVRRRQAESELFLRDVPAFRVPKADGAEWLLRSLINLILGLFKGGRNA
ncbi:lysozyme [uncultured Ruegeria sp.]|uniref:lysozyme n=1 Tax=uncultured Ruegeria sp. TaxID=259304 RepID=UPI00262A10F9|nr:lysozyme [uncultured Ruegeria sp.]